MVSFFLPLVWPPPDTCLVHCNLCWKANHKTFENNLNPLGIISPIRLSSNIPFWKQTRKKRKEKKIKRSKHLNDTQQKCFIRRHTHRHRHRYKWTDPIWFFPLIRQPKNVYFVCICMYHQANSVWKSFHDEFVKIKLYKSDPLR